VKVRQQGRIVSVAVIIAVGVNSDGRRGIGCQWRALPKDFPPRSTVQ
jgi:Transposase, Mutator family